MTADSKTQTYTTSDWDPGRDGPPVDPVVAVRLLPEGRDFVFRDLVDGDGRPRRWLLVGSGSTCDIVLTEPSDERTVSRKHCLVHCMRDGRVEVEHCDGYNRTKVNRTRLRRGAIELGPFDVLRVGKLELVALSQAALDGDVPVDPRVTASNPDEFFRVAGRLRGSLSAAAKAFNLVPSTLWRWLKKKRFLRPAT